MKFNMHNEYKISGFPLILNSPSRRRSLSIPFLTTSPLADVFLAFVLLPLWWLLGIEQFVWFLIFGLAAWKTIIRHRFRVHLSGPLVILVVFIGIYLLSGFSIIEGFRLITFLRNLSMYVTALFVLIVLTHEIQSESQLFHVTDAVLLAVGWASLIGIFAIIGIARPEIRSVIGYFLPASISQTDYGSRIVWRELGSESWFAGLGTYFRVRSLFLYGTMYATSIAITCPLLFYRFNSVQSRKLKWLLLGLGALFLVNLAFTTGRSAIAAFMIGLGYWSWITFGLSRRWGRVVILLLTFIGVVIAFVLAISTLQSYDFVQYAQAKIQAFLAARGSSTADRFYVYQKTLEGWSKRPFLGWGTERDIPGFRYPAGSHSYFLGTLYKQGLVGLTVFVLLLWSLWRSTSPAKIKKCFHSDAKAILRYGRWILVIYTINSLTDVLDLDATTMAITWTVFSILLTAASCRVRFHDEYG